jgi:hypothetical protein
MILTYAAMIWMLISFLPSFPHIPYSPFSLTLVLIMDYSYLMAIRPLFTMTLTYLKAVPT